MLDVKLVIKAAYCFADDFRDVPLNTEQPSKRLNTRPILPPSKRHRAAKREAALYDARLLLSLYPNERI
jgi:hypothetical protein